MEFRSSVVLFLCFAVLFLSSTSATTEQTDQTEQPIIAVANDPIEKPTKSTLTETTEEQIQHLTDDQEEPKAEPKTSEEEVAKPTNENQKAKTKKDQKKTDSEVLILTTENFQDTITKNENILIEFYAPWCGHCKALVPVYEKVAVALKGKLVIAKIDATKAEELANKYQIDGYPTIVLIREGEEVLYYDGDNDVKDLVNWATQNTKPPVTELTSFEAVNQLISEKNAIIYFGNNEKVKSILNKAARTAEDLEIGQVTNEKLIKEVAANVDTLKAYVTDGSVKELALSEETTLDQLKEWISFEAYPLFRNMNPVLFSKYVKQGKYFAMAFFNESDVEKWLPLFNEVAENIKPKLHLGWGSMKKYKTALGRFGGSGKVLPTLVAFPGQKSRKPVAWDESQEITKDNILTWLNQVLEGTAKPFRKSEPPPQQNDKPVKIVVGSTFESIVLDNSKDVLLEIYATWCGHCKSLEPLYNKLGELFQPIESVVIAQIEGNDNALPDNIKYDGFPTIYFFPANDKNKPISYDEGTRSLSAFTEFIRKHASIPFEAPKIETDFSIEDEYEEEGDGEYYGEEEEGEYDEEDEYEGEEEEGEYDEEDDEYDEEDDEYDDEYDDAEAKKLKDEL